MKSPCVLAAELRLPPGLNDAAKLRAIAAKILLQQDAFNRSGGNAAAKRFDVCAHGQERRAERLVRHGDEKHGTVRVTALIADGVVRVVSPIGANFRQHVTQLSRIDGLIDQRRELPLHGSGSAFRRSFYADTQDGSCRSATTSGALRQISLPGVIRQRIVQQSGLLLLCRCVAARGKINRFQVIGLRKALNVRHHHDVRQLSLLTFSAFNRYRKAALQNA